MISGSKIGLLVCGVLSAGAAQHASLLRGTEDTISKSLSSHYTDRIIDTGSPHRRSLNILALGGSITWGAELDDRDDEAFPQTIGKLYNEFMNYSLDVSVDNLAIRATGADYPSMCLQTLLSDAHPDDPMKSYDLILLDFILNGLEGFTALIHRLRRRYPDSEIVMVELWSLKGQIQEVGTNRTVAQVGIDPTRDWEWQEHIRQGFKSGRISATEAMVERFHGRHVALPRPETPRRAIDEHWFSRDWHHLSSFGHRVIAQTIFDILSSKSVVPLLPGKQVGSWGQGDKCYNWFLTGKVTLDFWGGRVAGMTALDGTRKSFIEINPVGHPDGAGGTIEFTSEFDLPVMMSLAYMSRQSPVLYPRVQVTVESGSVAKDMFTINPNFNRLEEQPTAHIATYTPLGYAYPGRNRLHILPLELTEQPFRVVGIYMCAVCTPYEEAIAAASF